MKQQKQKGKPALEWTKGIVSVVDDAKALVRCTIPDKDNIQTYWLEVIQASTARDKSYWLPDVGDQVIVLMDAEGSNGVVIGAIYSSVDVPPVSSRDKKHVSFDRESDFIEYDRATGVLTLNCKKLVVVCTEESTINNKAIAVIGAMDNDTESNGPDQLVTSGQF